MFLSKTYKTMQSAFKLWSDYTTEFSKHLWWLTAWQFHRWKLGRYGLRCKRNFHNNLLVAGTTGVGFAFGMHCCRHGPSQKITCHKPLARHFYSRQKFWLLHPKWEKFEVTVFFSKEIHQGKNEIRQTSIQFNTRYIHLSTLSNKFKLHVDPVLVEVRVNSTRGYSFFSYQANIYIYTK